MSSVSNKETGCGELLLLVVLAYGWSVADVLLGSWLMAKLWVWYMEPAGYLPVGWVTFIGVRLVWSLLGAKTEAAKEQAGSWALLVRHVNRVVFGYPWVLLLGWFFRPGGPVF